MNHSLRELTLSEMGEIYDRFMKEAFPPDEIKPMKRIREMYEANIYRGYGLFETDSANSGNLISDQLRCFGFYVTNPNTGEMLIDYLAVPASIRNMGYGSLFLQNLPQMTGTAPILLFEIENPEMAEDQETRIQRETRKHFYLSNGIVETPVSSRVFGVEYQILQYTSGTPYSEEEVRKALDRVYRTMFPEKWMGLHAIIREGYIKGEMKHVSI